MSILVTNLQFSYAMSGGPPVDALRGVNFRVEEGAVAAVLGAAGAGKSTLMLHLNGLLRAAPGSVSVDGFDPAASRAALREVRRRVGLVFQHPERQLFGATVGEDVAFGARNAGCSPDEIRRRVARALTDVGFDPEAVAGRSPFALSGGEQRRVAVAGVLALQPRYIVLDEPAAGLDGPGRSRLWELLHRLRARDNVGIAFVTHDVEEAARHADRMWVLQRGRVVLEGKPEDVLRPEHRDRLTAAGLALPAGAELAAGLVERGWDLPPGLYDEAAVARAVAVAEAKAANQVTKAVGSRDEGSDGT